MNNSKIKPWFPFYPMDWMSDRRVRNMTAEERGAYMQLLCEFWVNGPLPDSDSELLLAANVTRGEWDRVKDVVLACFERREGFYVNRRLEEIRVEQLAKYNKRAAAGQKGGEAKASNATKSRSNAGAMLEEDQALLEFALPTEQNRSDRATQRWNPTAEQLAAWMRNSAAKGGAIAPEDDRARRYNIQSDTRWAGKLLDRYDIGDILDRGARLIRWYVVKSPIDVDPTCKGLFKWWDTLDPVKIRAEAEMERAESEPAPFPTVIDGGKDSEVIDVA